MLDTSNFTGTEHYHRQPLSSLVYTDGVAYVAETAGAYWLLDKIAYREKRFDFEVWKLDVKKLTVTLEDGDDHVLDVEKLSFTDFPAPGIEIWVVNGVMLLPSEY